MRFPYSCVADDNGHMERYGASQQQLICLLISLVLANVNMSSVTLVHPTVGGVKPKRSSKVLRF